MVDLAVTAGGQLIFSETAENGCAFVSIPFAVGEKETLAVYYLNGDKAEELKFVAADKIAEADAGSFTYSDGCVLLKLAHFSQYLLLCRAMAPAAPPRPLTPASPPTAWARCCPPPARPGWVCAKRRTTPASA